VDWKIGAALDLIDDGRVVGVHSRSHILLAVNAGVDTAPVREGMSPGAIAGRADPTAHEASVLMIRGMVRQVFVVDEKFAPLGLSARPTCSWLSMSFGVNGRVRSSCGDRQSPC
jgi:predicted transcriptional regulator